jgi:hypothetical protein
MQPCNASAQKIIAPQHFLTPAKSKWNKPVDATAYQQLVRPRTSIEESSRYENLRPYSKPSTPQRSKLDGKRL